VGQPVGVQLSPSAHFLKYGN